MATKQSFLDAFEAFITQKEGSEAVSLPHGLYFLKRPFKQYLHYLHGI